MDFPEGVQLSWRSTDHNVRGGVLGQYRRPTQSPPLVGIANTETNKSFIITAKCVHFIVFYIPGFSRKNINQIKTL